MEHNGVCSEQTDSLGTIPLSRESMIRAKVATKDHMIFDLMDLFDRKPFLLIESNHCLTINYTFLCKNCLISWI